MLREIQFKAGIPSLLPRLRRKHFPLSRVMSGASFSFCSLRQGTQIIPSALVSSENFRPDDVIAENKQRAARKVHSGCFMLGRRA